MRSFRQKYESKKKKCSSIFVAYLAKQLVGVWYDGDTQLVVINASAGQCYYSMENVSPSRQYFLRFYRCDDSKQTVIR